MTDPRTQIGMRMRAADSVHARMFDRELVILDLERGEYFALDEVGAHLWVGLEKGRTIEEIAEEIVEQYETSVDHALADLVKLSEELLARGLIVPYGSNAG